MTRTILPWLTLFWLVISAALAIPAAAQDPGPIAGAMATLAAATAQAEQIRASQRATSAAISAENARLENIAQAQRVEATAQAQRMEATAQAQRVRSTQGAIDDLARRQAATAAAISVQATSQSMIATAEATRQAIMAAAQATDVAQLSETYATRQKRFTFGLFLVEVFFICGALFVIWRIVKALAAWIDRMRPRAEPTLAGLIGDETRERSNGHVVIDVGPAESARVERMPPTVQVYDNPRMVEAIDQWAARYDAVQGAANGNN